MKFRVRSFEFGARVYFSEHRSNYPELSKDDRFFDGFEDFLRFINHLEDF
jgi:hypothetical protein